MKFFYLWSSAWPCPSLLALILIFLTNVTIVKTEETSVQVCHMIMALETWRQWKTIIHNDGSKLQLLTPHNYIAYCVSHNFAPTAWIILSYLLEKVKMFYRTWKQMKKVMNSELEQDAVIEPMLGQHCACSSLAQRCMAFIAMHTWSSEKAVLSL